MLPQLAATCAALSVWAFGALARWRFDDTGDRITASQENVEAAVLAMGNRIALEMSTLDTTYRGKINQLYSETQGKLDAMDELLRARLTTASTTTTTISTIFNRFNDEGNANADESPAESESENGPLGIDIRPFLENDEDSIIGNKKKYGQKKYDQIFGTTPQKKYSPQKILSAWRQNWNLLPDGALGLSERDKLDLNYDELYGKQDLKDLADDVSWFNEEDMDKSGLVGHFEDAGEEVYRLYESDLEPRDDFYYSDYDYEEESYSDKEVSGDEGGEEKQEENAVEEERDENQTQLQIWRKRFSVRDRFSNSERTQPQTEQGPADDSVSEDQTNLGADARPNGNPSILALMSYNDRDVSGEKVEVKQEEEIVDGVVNEKKEEHATYPEVVDRAEQLQDKLQIWRDIFSVHTRFPNSERTRPRPEQASADNSVSEDPKPNANPSILALMK